ncbi:MAG: hypothetical protein ACI9JR_002963, partial [Gammaproteobacteria bacterium]
DDIRIPLPELTPFRRDLCIMQKLNVVICAYYSLIFS